jgi:hypothetical protein
MHVCFILGMDRQLCVTVCVCLFVSLSKSIYQSAGCHSNDVLWKQYPLQKECIIANEIPPLSCCVPGTVFFGVTTKS